MRRWRVVGYSAAAWVGVWAFWLVVTRGFHPTWAHGVVVTTSLVAAYAAASSINRLVLVPRFWRKGLRWRSLAWLAGTMALLTGLALAVIRAAYLAWSGPDADPYGAVKHYAIDLFGMAVHVGMAELVVWVVGRCHTAAGVPEESR